MIATLATALGRRRWNERNWAWLMSEGKTGGAAGMNLFQELYDNTSRPAIVAYHNARDPGETDYTYNESLWCSELLPQLSCVVVQTDDCGTSFGPVAGQDWRQRFGGVAITPRHVLGCGHAFLQAQGTWINGVVGNSPPTRRRFIGNNGNTVDRIQLHQGSFYGTVDDNGHSGLDLTVGLLDSDLPASVFIPKAAPSRFYFDLYLTQQIAVSQEWQPESYPYQHQAVNVSSYPNGSLHYTAVLPGEQSFGGISITQLVGGSSISISVAGLAITITAGVAKTLAEVATAVNAHLQASAIITAQAFVSGGNTGLFFAGSGSMADDFNLPSDYPVLNRTMVWQAGPYNTRQGFGYSVWGGDSGTPELKLMANGELVVSGIVSGAHAVFFPYYGYTFADYLNMLIVKADQNAVLAGRIESPTGYTVTEYEP